MRTASQHVSDWASTVVRQCGTCHSARTLIFEEKICTLRCDMCEKSIVETHNAPRRTFESIQNPSVLCWWNDIGGIDCPNVATLVCSIHPFYHVCDEHSDSCYACVVEWSNMFPVESAPAPVVDAIIIDLL